jgi:WD40 repeat protein
MVDIIPESPNSALPSPVSDLDPEETWSTPPTIRDIDIEEAKPEDTIYNNTKDTIYNTTLDTSSLIETFDTLPDNIQTYFMFQLLKRSPRNALRMANATIMQALKRDFILDLPESISSIILGYLDVRSLCRATGVNHSWQRLIDNASDVWKLKMIESDFVPTANESNLSYKCIVRRHTIMRRNWRKNLHHKMLLEGHEEDLVTCLQFDDEKIITGSDDHKINVYDINTGKLKSTLEGHEGGVWALQYVGNTLVTGSIDRTVRVWDIKRGVCRFVLRGHSSTVRCLKIVMPTEIRHADGSITMEPSEPIIVSGSRDMTIRVWRLPDLETEPEMPLSTCLEDDVISKRFLKYKLVEHENSVRDLAVHGNTLVSGSYDNNVIVWNLDTGSKIHILKGHGMKVYCVAIDPKRRHCISGSLDASVRIWDIDTGECKFVLQGKKKKKKKKDIKCCEL